MGAKKFSQAQVFLCMKSCMTCHRYIHVCSKVVKCEENQFRKFFFYAWHYAWHVSDASCVLKSFLKYDAMHVKSAICFVCSKYVNFDENHFWRISYVIVSIFAEGLGKFWCCPHAIFLLEPGHIKKLWFISSNWPNKATVVSYNSIDSKSFEM